MLQGGCKINATRFDLDKAIGSKYVKFVVNSFIGKGGGLQYLGLEMEKGIDPGVRGDEIYIQTKERCQSQFAAIFLRDTIASDWQSSPQKDGWKYCVDCLANQRRLCPSGNWREPEPYTNYQKRSFTLSRLHPIQI